MDITIRKVMISFLQYSDTPVRKLRHAHYTEAQTKRLLVRVMFLYTVVSRGSFILHAPFRIFTCVQ